MGENNLVEWPPEGILTIVYNIFTHRFGPPDVDFRAGTRVFKVHKKVLENQSSVLKAKLSDIWKTSGDVLQLDEEYVEPEVVEELLKWLYNTEALPHIPCKCDHLEVENAKSLCVAADYLIMPKLIASCCKVLGSGIEEENFYELFTFSKHRCLNDLGKACELVLTDRPTTFFLSPQVVEWKIEDLKMLIQKLLEVKDSPNNRGTILSSLAIWIDSDEDRFRELNELLEFVSPETLPSNALFRFMEIELYSKLDESHRKQYYVRSYLSTGVSSTDKLYCVTKNDPERFIIANCLDLSAGGQWPTNPERYWTYSEHGLDDVSVLSLDKKIYFLQYMRLDDPRNLYYSPSNKRKCCVIIIKVFSAETGKWIGIGKNEKQESFELSKFRNYQEMLASVALDSCIYMTFSGKSFIRLNLEKPGWKRLEKMQTDRSKHLLVALDSFLYAIGGEVLEPDSRPERYDLRANQWQYIAPTNYHHTLPAAVAHEGQIYVFSQAGFEAYSPETDQWTQLPAPDVCLRPSLVSIAGRLWLMTESVNSPELQQVYQFDIVDQKWTRLPDLPEGNYTDFSIVIKY